jgi:hypothetical protein
MTYHESYGSLPTSTLRLIKAKNVSPADYDDILAQYGMDYTDADKIPFDMVEDLIRSSSKSGYYVRRFI